MDLTLTHEPSKQPKVGWEDVEDTLRGMMDRAFAHYRERASATNWSVLIAAMLAYQQARESCTLDRPAMADILAALPVVEWQEAVVRKVTGMSIAQVLRDNA